MPEQPLNLQIQLTELARGQRLDQVLAGELKDYSRAKLQGWINKGWVRVNGEQVACRYRVVGRELVTIEAWLESLAQWSAEVLPLQIIYEDEALLVVNKPSGMVSHPGAGNWTGTLVNALLHHCPILEHLPRAGLIHRLDKDTTGLLIVAKNLVAHTHLAQLLQDRALKRSYLALVQGHIVAGGTVDAPIGRDPRQRLRMAVVEHGKPARTHYRVAQSFGYQTLLEVNLETGRTHQIRVHMAHLGHPLVGDSMYAGRRLLSKGGQQRRDCLSQMNRQALHAYKLELNHPITNELMQFEAPVPQDLQDLLNCLEKCQS